MDDEQQANHRKRTHQMSKSTGDTIPEVTLLLMRDGVPTEVSSKDVLGQGKAVLFAMPGAFTATCSGEHMPSVVDNADALRAKGVTTIAVLAVNDPFAMQAWGEMTGAVAKGVVMLADPQAAWAEDVGLTFSVPERGLINRSARYAMVIEDGEITRHEIDEAGPVCTISSGANVLEMV